MPMRLADYGPDWPAVSRRIRFERAENRCESCGVQNHAVGARDHTGKWWDEYLIYRIKSDDGIDLFGGDGVPKMVKIVLTTAHLPGYAKTDHRDEALMALCHQCHNRLDAPMRGLHAAQTRARRRGQLELCLEAG